MGLIKQSEYDQIIPKHFKLLKEKSCLGMEIRTYCSHKKVRFLGVQETLKGKPMKLYNCRNCFTTLSAQTLKEIKLC